MTTTHRYDDRPRVGISQCLLGEEVRYDGGHKRDRFITDVLAGCFDWVPVCPEMEVGMGTPREPVRLQRGPDGPRMVGVESGEDWTGRMRAYSRRRCDELAPAGLRGFILKSASPSCGMEEVELHDRHDGSSRDGVGLFARQLMDRFPDLPVEEEGSLDDLRLRDSFICRVYTYHRWRRVRDAGAGPGQVAGFHARHELLLRAHDPDACGEMDDLIARAGDLEPAELLDRYQASLMAALARPAPVRGHVSALQRVTELLGPALDADDRAEILRAIEEYRRGATPLVTPLTRLKYHLRQVDDPWIHDQVYLNPYPSELAVRGHL